MKIYKPIIIIAGEPNSVFLEIYFKTINLRKTKCPIILIASKELVLMQMKRLKFKNKIRLLETSKLHIYKLDNKQINLIDVNYKQKNPFEKISKKSNKYIKTSFNIAFEIIKKGISNKLINGPISKKHLLNKKIIKDKIYLIDKFYKQKFNIKPTIGVLGLNPHCESIDKFNEDEKIIKPVVTELSKKKIKISGPYSADTIFLKKNRTKFNVIVGMYHDQVLTPLKTLFEYDAINITLGLPFLRISPDHGPNVSMLGKNLSNPLSLIKAISFLDKN